MPVLNDPHRARNQDCTTSRNVGGAMRRPRGRAPSRVAGSWAELEALGAAAIPYVVETASKLSPADRLAHVAFVGRLAFGRCDDASVECSAEGCGALHRTAARLAKDASFSSAWEAWESGYLIAACAALLGRHRREEALARAAIRPRPDMIAVASAVPAPSIAVEPAPVAA
jgi:hypothetical protein